MFGEDLFCIIFTNTYNALFISVDNSDQMVGSYGPSNELKSYWTPIETAPAGMLSRGTYTVHSKFIDDDRVEYLKWDWAFEITKEWKWTLTKIINFHFTLCYIIFKIKKWNDSAKNHVISASQFIFFYIFL